MSLAKTQQCREWLFLGQDLEYHCWNLSWRAVTTSIHQYGVPLEDGDVRMCCLWWLKLRPKRKDALAYPLTQRSPTVLIVSLHVFCQTGSPYGLYTCAAGRLLTMQRPQAGHKALHTCTSWYAYAATFGSPFELTVMIHSGVPPFGLLYSTPWCLHRTVQVGRPSADCIPTHLAFAGSCWPSVVSLHSAYGARWAICWGIQGKIMACGLGWARLVGIRVWRLASRGIRQSVTVIILVM